MSRRRRKGPETAPIESATHDGRGIARIPGKKVFVAGALPGETVVFQRRKRRRNYDEAELLEVLEASDSRIEPRCAAYGRCGGCVLQHLDDAEQRRLKMQALEDAFRRIGGVAPERWLSPIYDETDNGSWNYRRRARLAVKDVAAKGRVLVGFRERHAPYVCDMHRCEVLAGPVDALIDPLSELVGRLSIRARLPQIEVAVADNAVELVFRVLDPPTSADLEALRGFAATHNVQIALQDGGPDSTEALDEGNLPLEYRIPESDLVIRFRATDFVQVNGGVNRLMISSVLELLECESAHAVLDLYAGIGNFSLALARRAARVLGIEGMPAQVQAARDNADLNDLGHCEFLCADLDEIDGTEGWLAEPWDRVLLDPARTGARAVCEQLARRDTPRIAYVSCHPGTLARDAGILVNVGGYQLEAAGIIDMFPHTGHVESLAIFQKR